MRELRLAASSLPLLAVVGCATLFSGVSDEIMFESDPPGAEIFVNGQRKGVTPKEVVVGRGQKAKRAELRLEGYKTESFRLENTVNGLAFLNLTCIPCWLVDLATGAITRHDQVDYDVQLTALDPRYPPPGTAYPQAAAAMGLPPAARSLEEPEDPLGARQALSVAAVSLRLGRFHALVIGNDIYEHEEIPQLRTAVSDARAVATVLRDHYGYDVQVLLNAGRSEIISAIAGYRRKLGPDDNLLIFYAGHGIWDQAEDQGYWLPTDAATDDPAQWIANATVTRQLKAMTAKHVMVIADSCYSGTLTRGIHVPPRAPGYLQRLIARRSRTALTSGGLEPVPDGTGNNSAFAAALLEVLATNDEVLEATSLFALVRRKVVLNSSQTPQYAPIVRAGHDDGEFVFVPVVEAP